ncbi:MAG: hypothetical protein HW380_642 [Magnetococcales bacterium]|nr:hypothetical protein [Magnetococcales bacterium]
MPQQCQECSLEIPVYVGSCPHCARPSLFPNVTDAGQPEKRQALAGRYQQACSEASSRGAGGEVHAFAEQVEQNAKVCIARYAWEVKRLVASEHHVYGSFYQEVDAGLRLPEENSWDSLRKVADQIVLPHYQKEIRFGCLSLNNAGPGKYGEAFLALEKKMIEHRTTLFETNSARYIGDNPGLKELPPGMQAVWEDRARLAVAKLAVYIGVGTTAGDFPAILLKDAPHDGDEYIEAHVYGSITIRTVGQVTFSSVVKKEHTRVFFRNIKRKLKIMNIVMEQR